MRNNSHKVANNKSSVDIKKTHDLNILNGAPRMLNILSPNTLRPKYTYASDVRV